MQLIYSNDGITSNSTQKMRSSLDEDSHLLLEITFQLTRLWPQSTNKISIRSLCPLVQWLIEIRANLCAVSSTPFGKVLNDNLQRDIVYWISTSKFHFLNASRHIVNIDMNSSFKKIFSSSYSVLGRYMTYLKESILVPYNDRNDLVYHLIKW